MDEDVSGFEISVDDAIFMEIVESLAYLEKHIKDFIHFFLASLLSLFFTFNIAFIHHVSEISSIAKFGDNVEKSIALESVRKYLEGIFVSNNVRMLYFFQDRNLFFYFLLCDVAAVDLLDGNCFLEFFVESLMNYGIPL